MTNKERVLKQFPNAEAVIIKNKYTIITPRQNSDKFDALASGDTAPVAWCNAASKLLGPKDKQA